MNQAKGYRIVNIDEVNHVEDTFKSIEPLRELEVIDGDYDDVIEERVSVKIKIIIFILNSLICHILMIQ